MPEPPVEGPKRMGKTPKPYKVLGQWYHPIGDATGFEQQGLASWYGEPFHGRPTSTGEIYDMYKVSAAHKTLPLGTYVLVQNQVNGKELTVRINDRGPFVNGRIIDLSMEAARRLDILGPGTAGVVVTALGKSSEPVDTDAPPTSFTPVDYYSGNFTFQVGAFRSLENAEAFRRRLDISYQNAHISQFFDGRETFYRVRVGLCHDLDMAQEYEQTLAAQGFQDAFVVAQ
jgi:rare lipoprotein A